MADDAAKSVIEIDLNDGSWKQFQASFNQYQKALGAGKKEMAAVGVAGAKAATQKIRTATKKYRDLLDQFMTPILGDLRLICS